MTTEADLQALIVGNAAFEDIERSSRRFCPFEAIGMVRQEIRHAHFLAYSLDPQRPHGFGSEPLRAFLQAAAASGRGDSPALSSLDVHLADLSDVEVRREWRRIDLVVVVASEKLIVAIELKIDASEHSRQLQRYRETVEVEWTRGDGWRHLLLFLTPDGVDPTEDATGWIAMDFPRLLNGWSELVAREVGVPEARALFAAYIAMLRRHMVTDERLEDIARRLWAQHGEALDFLMDRRPDSASGLIGILFQHREELALMLAQATGLDVCLDRCTPRILNLAVREWDVLPGFLSAQSWTRSNRLLLLEIANGGTEGNLVRIRLVLGPGDAEVRRDAHARLTNANLGKTARASATERFTRLDSERISVGATSEVDATSLLEGALAKIREYGERLLPAYDRALRQARNNS